MAAYKEVDLINFAKEVFDIEAKALLDLKTHLNADFAYAAQKMAECQGRVIVCGMGKSGHIGKKMAATFASTGTPSFFVHPSEAFHGDLGMFKSEDVFLSISNSGETDEILRLIPFVQKQGMTHVCITGNLTSTLAKNADHVLNVKVYKEACPLQLAPTSSTTATLAMGDALAVALIRMKGFQQENFAMYHPGGSLGRKLLMKVRDEMIAEDLPIISKDTSIKDVIVAVTHSKIGTVAVTDKNIYIEGVITDGDLRRALFHYDQNTFFDLKAADIMSNNPKTVVPDMAISQAEEMMELYKIKALIVAEDNKLVGIFV